MAGLPSSYVTASHVCRKAHAAAAALTRLRQPVRSTYSRPRSYTRQADSGKLPQGRLPLLSAAVACPRAGPAIGTSPLSGYCTHITRYPQLVGEPTYVRQRPATGSKPGAAYARQPMARLRHTEPRDERREGRGGTARGVA